MKKALQDIKVQLKDLMHQSESLLEIKALLRLSDEIDNVLEIMTDNRPAAAPKAAASRSKTAKNQPAAKPASSSNASAQPAPATTKMPAASAGKSKKKETFIDPGDR